MSQAGADTVATAGKTLRRFLICGSPDDGDVALIGSLFDAADVISKEPKEERRSSIFGDIGAAPSRTASCAFTIAASGDDTLGLVATASGSELTVLLVDARRGVSAQTRRRR